eukprot:scaffold5157_cov100-Skeletonema_dohrnii-CCMP3373.AAC.1
MQSVTKHEWQKSSTTKVFVGPCKAILDRTPLLVINTRTLHKHNHRRARGVIKLSDVEEWRDQNLWRATRLCPHPLHI